jgi:hypothetical protein
MGVVRESVIGKLDEIAFARVKKYIAKQINSNSGEEANHYFDTSLVLDAVIEWGDRISWRPGRVNELRRAWNVDQFYFDRKEDN